MATAKASSSLTLDQYLEQLDEQKKSDSKVLIQIMQEVTNEKPKLISGSMISFGKYHYKYEIGHEGDSFLTGFAARKAAFTLYLGAGFDENQQLDKLCKFTTGTGCLYIKKLKDVDLEVLRELIKSSVQRIKELFPQ